MRHSRSDRSHRDVCRHALSRTPPQHPRNLRLSYGWHLPGNPDARCGTTHGAISRYARHALDQAVLCNRNRPMKTPQAVHWLFAAAGPADRIAQRFGRAASCCTEAASLNEKSKEAFAPAQTSDRTLRRKAAIKRSPLGAGSRRSGFSPWTRARVRLRCDESAQLRRSPGSVARRLRQRPVPRAPGARQNCDAARATLVSSTGALVRCSESKRGSEL